MEKENKKKYADIKNFYLKIAKTDESRKFAMLSSIKDMIEYYKITKSSSFIERCRDTYKVYRDFGYEPKDFIDEFFDKHKEQPKQPTYENMMF